LNLLLELKSFDDIVDVEAIIVAVAHEDYLELDIDSLKHKLNYRGLIMDVKGILDPNSFKDSGIMYWRL
jgi:UDP-N-acetyl-D-glucosamine/UDP-N-acetyl-D-galactosamine dehydrogenase